MKSVYVIVHETPKGNQVKILEHVLRDGENRRRRMKSNQAGVDEGRVIFSF